MPTSELHQFVRVDFTTLRHLTWTASEDKILGHYELRGCAGLDFEGTLEEVLARVVPDAPLELMGELSDPRGGCPPRSQR